ncbi:hypothetical protein H0H92_006391 [Tricholoma furcatifolium]|nr:hypothetical protein H0H92_006391 [Tricholoma furcatifolium]
MLEKLELSVYRRFSKLPANLFDAIPRLTTLKLDGCFIIPGSFPALARLTNLRLANTASFFGLSQLLSLLQPFAHLEKLALVKSCASKMPSTTMPHLDFPRLKTLRICDRYTTCARVLSHMTHPSTTKLSLTASMKYPRDFYSQLNELKEQLTPLIHNIQNITLIRPYYNRYRFEVQGIRYQEPTSALGLDSELEPVSSYMLINYNIRDLPDAHAALSFTTVFDLSNVLCVQVKGDMTSNAWLDVFGSMPLLVTLSLEGTANDLMKTLTYGLSLNDIKAAADCILQDIKTASRSNYFMSAARISNGDDFNDNETISLLSQQLDGLKLPDDPGSLVFPSLKTLNIGVHASPWIPEHLTRLDPVLLAIALYARNVRGATFEHISVIDLEPFLDFN